MRKFFALTLAVVMVLAVASTAMAFSWGKPADATADAFANRYKIEVVKLANETGIIGTSKLIEAPAATAVNNASVYFYIRLTVTGASSAPNSPNPSPPPTSSPTDDRDAVQLNAKATVSFTALNEVPTTAGALPEVSGLELQNLANGVYYYNLAGATASPSDATAVFTKINETSNSVFSNAAIEGRVLDTATAKAYAKVTSERPLPGFFNYGSYDINVLADRVEFYKAASPWSDIPVAGNLVATFFRDGNGKVTKVENSNNGQDVTGLYQWLNAGSADTIRAAIANGEMYMTNANIRAAFGFDYKVESSITWNANSTAIILDPAIGVGIPKTGDNASVIGFAMVMIAVVGAAVAVKKVRA